MSDKARGPKGRFVRSLAGAERDAEAARLRSRGLSYEAIGRELGLDKGNAYKAVQRALDSVVREPADELRQLELGRLDDMWQATLAVLEAKHFTVSNGKLIYHPETGGPLLDDGPVLAAVDRLLRIQERRAKLLGLDQATRLNVDAENLGREIGELINVLGASDSTDRTDAGDDGDR